MTDKRVQILQLLQKRTGDGEIVWEQRSTNAFVAQVGSSVVQLEEIPSRSPEPDYKVSLFNEDGDLAESFTDVTLYDELDERFYSTMQKLFVAARRSALGADKTFDDIISALSKPAENK